MEHILQLMNLLNATTPGVAQLVLMVKQKNGTVSVVALLDEADDQFAANINQAKDWLANNK